MTQRVPRREFLKTTGTAAAFGNSDGDQQMLQWTAAGPGRRLMLLVDHTDAEREYVYRVSPMGRLEKALDEAQQQGWLVVDMKQTGGASSPSRSLDGAANWAIEQSSGFTLSLYPWMHAQAPGLLLIGDPAKDIGELGLAALRADHPAALPAAVDQGNEVVRPC